MSNYLIDKLGNNSDSIYTAISFIDIQGKNLLVGLESLNPHVSVKQIVQASLVDKEFIKQTNIYACLRNPITRFISRSYHIKNFDKELGVKDFNKNQLVERCLTMYDPDFHMWWPQTTWCMLDGKPVNKLFLYEDFDRAASEMTGIDAKVNYHHRNDCNEHEPIALDSSLVQEIEKLYADDVALYNSIKK
jgi:hypothetical protein